MKKLMLSSLLSIGLLLNVGLLAQSEGTTSTGSELTLDVISPQYSDDIIEGNH